MNAHDLGFGSDHFNFITSGGAIGRLDAKQAARLAESCRMLEFAQLGHLDSYKQGVKAGASDTEILEVINDVKKEAARFDAAGLFLERDREYHDPRQFEALYRKMNWQDFFPVTNLGTAGLDDYRYDMFNGQAEAQPLIDNATDIKMVNDEMDSFTKKIKSIGLGYGYSIKELRAHALTGKPLDTRRIQRVLKGYDQKMYKMVFNGDAVLNIDGFLNYANVTNQVAHTSAGTNVTWAAKIAANEQDAVLKDIGDLVSGMAIDSENNFGTMENKVTIGVDLENFLLIARTPRSTTSDTTILQYALKNIIGLEGIIPMQPLKGAGTGATNLMLGWVNDPEYLEFVTATGVNWFEMIKPNARTFRFESDMEIVGSVVRYTPALYQIYGI
jgi:hypothetical protein